MPFCRLCFIVLFALATADVVPFQVDAVWCTNSSQSIQRTCYFVARNNASIYVSFKDALDTCEANGWKFASIHSQEENKEIHDHLLYQYWTWIGLERVPRSAVATRYVWNDQTITDWTNWQSGEPNNAAMSSQGLWAMLDCALSINMSFVCKQGKYSTETSDSILTSVVSICKEGSCFTTFGAQTYQQATDFCTSVGAKLSTVLSDEANTMVNSIVERSTVTGAWLGASDTAGAYASFSIERATPDFRKWKEHSNGSMERTLRTRTGTLENQTTPQPKTVLLQTILQATGQYLHARLRPQQSASLVRI